MGIDGIGKPPGAAIGGAVGIQGSEAARPAEPFAALRSTSPAEEGGRVSAALSGLQRGELTLDQYLDGRVNDATEHLSGKISPEQLEFVKQSLREQMATDPVLVELVQRTTGFRPAAEFG